jgi:hypothetical protein
MLGIKIEVSMSYEWYSLFGISLDHYRSQWKCDVTDSSSRRSYLEPEFSNSEGIVGVYKEDKGFQKPI